MIFLNKWMNAFHMKKLNDEQRLIVDDTIYKKHKFPSKPFHIFLIRGT
jgi:hypothetical protein